METIMRKSKVAIKRTTSNFSYLKSKKKTRCLFWRAVTLGLILAAAAVAIIRLSVEASDHLTGT